jgi:hypothetical protein
LLAALCACCIEHARPAACCVVLVSQRLLHSACFASKFATCSLTQPGHLDLPLLACILVLLQQSNMTQTQLSNRHNTATGSACHPIVPPVGPLASACRIVGNFMTVLLSCFGRGFAIRTGDHKPISRRLKFVFIDLHVNSAGVRADSANQLPPHRRPFIWQGNGRLTRSKGLEVAAAGL